jgi:hypothetical protein
MQKPFNSPKNSEKQVETIGNTGLTNEDVAAS